MVKIYVKLIIAGFRTIEQVPPNIKEEVKQALIDLEMEHLAE